MAKKTGRHKRKHTLTAKERIMASEEWVSEGLDYCRDTGEWPEWEKRLLAHIKEGNTSEIIEGVQYALEVLDSPWPDLEPPLLDWMCAGGQVWADPEAVEAFVFYIEGTAESETLANLILEKTLAEPAVLYASRCMEDRWPEAEQMILDADTPRSEAVLYGYHEESDLIQNQITVYARDLIGGRWPAFEEKVRRGECNPITVASYTSEVIGCRWKVAEDFLLGQAQVSTARTALVRYARDVIQGRWKKAEAILCVSPLNMLQYAKEVRKGKLPEALHQAMVMKSFEFPDDPDVQKYFAEFGR
jgi:hypothetical protein